MNSIRLAALLGHEKILGSLLRLGQRYDFNESDDVGRTVFTWASQFGHGKVVQMLLDRGADVDAQGGQYGNALQSVPN